MKNKSIFLLSLMILTACSSVKEHVSVDSVGGETREPAAKTYILSRWEGRRSEAASWGAHTLSALETHGSFLLANVPANIEKYCANYASLNREKRKKFWTYLISAISHFESGMNPNDSYLEPFKDSKGRSIVSRGIMALSWRSANAYGCGFRSSDEVDNTEKSLTCTVKMMESLVRRDSNFTQGSTGRTAKGLARYWSVMRPGGRYSRTAAISGWTKEFCQSL